MCCGHLAVVVGSTGEKNDITEVETAGDSLIRHCVERMAETAGCHFFKCPLCNNKEKFCQEMQEFGIYLPDQDAEWETGSAYDDQLERHGTCDVASCLCPGGRTYDVDDSPWEIVLCSYCGAQVCHHDSLSRSS